LAALPVQGSMALTARACWRPFLCVYVPAGCLIDASKFMPPEFRVHVAISARFLGITISSGKEIAGANRHPEERSPLTRPEARPLDSWAEQHP